jgi:hypothetical protein
MENCKSKWCNNASQYGVKRPEHLLFDKLRSNSKSPNDSQTTKKISVQISKPIGNMDNAFKERKGEKPGSPQSDNGIQTLETPSKNKEDFVWCNIDRHHEHQNNIIGDTTDVRLGQSTNFATRCEWKFVKDQGSLGSQQLCRDECVVPSSTVETRSSNRDTYNFHKRTRNDGVILKLSNDDGIQRGEDLPTLFNILKNEHQFYDETNKGILYDNEFNIIAKTYNVIDAYPIFAYDNSIFWLKDLNDVIYIWYRTDEILIYGGHNIREALINFLFHPENLCYINEDDHSLISRKEAEEIGIRCYREGKETAVVSEESLKLLEKEKEGSKKGGGKKKVGKKRSNKKKKNK